MRQRQRDRAQNYVRVCVCERETEHKITYVCVRERERAQCMCLKVARAFVDLTPNLVFENQKDQEYLFVLCKHSKSELRVTS